MRIPPSTVRFRGLALMGMATALVTMACASSPATTGASSQPAGRRASRQEIAAREQTADQQVQEYMCTYARVHVHSC